MRKNPRPDAVDAKTFRRRDEEVGEEKRKSYEWKFARRSGGAWRGHCRGLDWDGGFDCRGTQSGGSHESFGAVNSGHCLRGSDRVLHTFPGQVRKGKEIWCAEHARGAACRDERLTMY